MDIANDMSSKLIYEDVDTCYEKFYYDLAFSHNLEDFKQRIYRWVKQLQCTDYLFLRLERVWCDESRRGLLHSLPDELVRVYYEEHLHLFDLVFQYSRSSTQAIFSSQIYDYIDNASFDMNLMSNSA